MITQVPDQLSDSESNWDVVIIGAGPAGTSAAIECARLGCNVLLVEAKSFPRRKVCGGCLNVFSLGQLRSLIGPEHPLWQRACSVPMYQLLHRHRRFRFDLPGGATFERSELDEALVGEAIRHGAVFWAPATAVVESVEELHVKVAIQIQNRRLGSVKAKGVIVAGGLGCQASVSNTPFRFRVSKSSRVGIAATLPIAPESYVDPGVYMAVADDGYVGITQVADGRLHLAAAVDRYALQRWGPQPLTGRILAAAGADPIDLESSISWRGTPPLTVRADRFAVSRIFLVGDAAGYIEPFTGEGIRWALATGKNVAQYAHRLLADSPSNVATAWDRWYRQSIARDQRTCRTISWALRSRSLRWMAHHLLAWRPAFAQPIIHGLNPTLCN